VIYANGPRVLAAALLAGHIARRPVIWHLHNVFQKGPELRLLCCLGKYANLILACSQAAARPLVQGNPWLQFKIQVVSSGIPAWCGIGEPPCLANRMEKFSRPAKALFLGILGRVTPAKGQHIFLEATALVRRNFPNVHFFVVGSPAPGDRQDLSYWHGLHQKVHELQLNEAVHFIGHQSEMQNIYALLDVVVVASTIAEALPLTVLEAMAFEKAIVAPSAGGIMEMLEHNFSGVLVDDLQAEGLAAGMKSVIEDSRKRARLGAKARQQAYENFSPVRFLCEIQKALQSCLST
jgi:glycosyltransferase involved in cell wall biosynthesis